ncbi:MAG: metallophosphoesterase [Rhodobacteraceae bacterium]|nr:metallophosphoesterase [Paracoccaceae bacterium]
MKLFAISDLHLSGEINRQAVRDMPAFPGDWLILAGDVAEKFSDIQFGFEEMARRFDKVFWAPGNHDLWAIRRDNDPDPLRGEARYHALVEMARSLGIHTPEDPYVTLDGHQGAQPLTVAPLFVLYDYSFRPSHVSRDNVVAWAKEKRMACGDEFFLHHEPHDSRDAWCAARVDYSLKRLSEIPDNHRTILVNHFPLREELVHIPRAPRFSPWCGTKQTEDWHHRFRAHTIVSGHLHIRRSDQLDGVNFEEVSLGYPKQWDQKRGLAAYLREIVSR